MSKKKDRKRLWSLCILLSLAAAAISGCSGSGKNTSSGGGGGTEPDPDKVYDITYTGYWCYSDYEDGSFAEKMIEDALNINLTVEKAETTDTIDLLLASGEMPDCMWTEEKTLSWMQAQELIRTIPKEMVEKYCPLLLNYYDENPLIYKMVLNPENEEEFLYLAGLTFQFVDYYLPGDCYRYDWIENLGIDLGVNVEQVSDRLYVADNGIELSKFAEIMDGFVNKDPDGNGKNDTLGATAPDWGVGNIGQFYSAYGFAKEINNVNGRAEHSYAMEEYKEFLKGFQDLYARNLIDPEIISLDRTLAWDKINTGAAGYWLTSVNTLNSWAVDRPPLTLFDRDPNAKILITPGIRPDGGEVRAAVNPTPAYGRFFVNRDVDDEKLAKILQFFNYSILGNGDKEIVASLFFGEKDVDWKWDEAKETPIKINNLNSGDKGTWSFSQFGQTEEVTQWIGEEELFRAGGKYWSAKDGGSWLKWQHRPYKEDLANETKYGDIFQKIRGDLDAYVSNYRTQAILGQIDIDSTWDSYLAELDRLGYNTMMDELEKIPPIEEMIEAYEKD
ncbi:hypothetical protein VSQ48_10040 [Candidatus Ventrimonas sp. KK005]|nr:hypothetical protein [Clostridiaceae bacterium]